MGGEWRWLSLVVGLTACGRLVDFPTGCEGDSCDDAPSQEAPKTPSGSEPGQSSTCDATRQERCDDHVDNDCDGAIDCADAACAGLPCDDGAWCTLVDTCVDRSCVGAGDPCAAASDADCAACNEDSDDCSAHKQSGSACDCTPESDDAFCARLEATCGLRSGTDNCGAPREVDCGTCVSYDWQVGMWGDCSATCGDGTRSRSVSCRRNDGALVSETYCSGARPDDVEDCRVICCPPSPPGHVLCWSRAQYDAQVADSCLSTEAMAMYYTLYISGTGNVADYRALNRNGTCAAYCADYPSAAGC